MDAHVSSIPHGGPGSGCCGWCDPDAPTTECGTGLDTLAPPVEVVDDDATE